MDLAVGISIIELNALFCLLLASIEASHCA